MRFLKMFAASVDSDNDHFPDSWNTGRTKNDSTTNLHLDTNSASSEITVDVLSMIPEFENATKRSGLIGWFFRAK